VTDEHMPPALPRTLAWMLAIFAAGCTTADSAQGERGLPVAWTVAAEPVLRVGGSDAEGLASVTGAVSLEDDGVAVADAGTQRIDVFDARGKRVRSLGREGGGPGEFSFPGWIGLRGDTLRVWDVAHARLSLFDTAGRFLRTEPPVTEMGSFPRVAGQFGDGSLLLAGTDREGWRIGTFRDSLLLVRIRPGEDGRDTLGRVPGDEQFGSRSADGRVTESNTLPFGRRTLMAAHEGAVYVGTGDGDGILRSDNGGPWRTAARVDAPRNRVTRQDIDDYWHRLITRGAGARDARRPDGIEYPSQYPPFVDLVVASDGDVWICLPSRPSQWGQGSRWLVFRADGTVRGSVLVPGRSRVVQIGTGWMLVVETDGDDRQMVARYTLAAPAS
jgi:hypothetical protein